MGDNLQAMHLLIRLPLLSAVSAALLWLTPVIAEEPNAAPGGAAIQGQGAASADTLERTRIDTEYGEGNFEVVIQLLEEYRTGHKAIPASDSLFIAKYLGVVYASNPASREKGKYWLYRMLQIHSCIPTWWTCTWARPWTGPSSECARNSSCAATIAASMT